jgi:hypothetical protein
MPMLEVFRQTAQRKYSRAVVIQFSRPATSLMGAAIEFHVLKRRLRNIIGVVDVLYSDRLWGDDIV